MNTISSVNSFWPRNRSAGFPVLLRGLVVVCLLLTAGGCTTTYKDFEGPQESGGVDDDRPLSAFNRLMAETLPIARKELEESSTLRPRAFALSRQGGVRPVTILGATARDDEARLRLLVHSLEVMTRGDDIVAFVIYASGSGYLVNTPSEDQVLVAHLEHHSGRAVLRRLSYVFREGDVQWGAEDVDATDALLFTDVPSP